jgi:hypothetical protein
MLLLIRPIGLFRATVWRVGHRLSTAVARVLSQIKSYGIYGGRSNTGARFLLIFFLPQSVRIPLNIA